MNTYLARRATRRTTGHYRKPGTDRSYCGHDLDHTPTPAAEFRAICKTCVKAEQRDRAAAEQVAAAHDRTAPTLAERADVTLAMVGRGTRPHYADGDETLCRRPLDSDHRAEAAALRVRGGSPVCAPCTRAAEQRAYARRLAAASPLATAAVDLAETIEQADTERAAEERAERRQQLADSRGANAYPLAVDAVRRFVREMPKAGALRVRVVEGSPEANLTRDDLHALAYSGHTTADAVARVRAAVATHVRHGEREVHVMFPALGMRPALYLPDVMALLTHWEHGQAEAEQFDRAARGVATVEDAEALYAAALVTEAEATAGTWRGEWIGETDTAGALFSLTPNREQGALFA